MDSVTLWVPEYAPGTGENCGALAGAAPVFPGILITGSVAVPV